MESEAQFITFLLAPWVLALLAWVYYRRRQKRKAHDAESSRENGSGGG